MMTSSRKQVAERWSYVSEQNEKQFDWQMLPITPTQKKQILHFAGQHADIMRDMIVLFGEPIDAWKKGQSTWALKCLRGDIKPHPLLTDTPPTSIGTACGHLILSRQVRLAQLQRRLATAYTALGETGLQIKPEPALGVNPVLEMAIAEVLPPKMAHVFADARIMTLGDLMRAVTSYGLTIERTKHVEFGVPTAPRLDVPYRVWMTLLHNAHEKAGFDWEAYTMQHGSLELIRACRIETKLNQAIQLLIELRELVHSGVAVGGNSKSE